MKIIKIISLILITIIVANEAEEQAKEISRANTAQITSPAQVDSWDKNGINEFGLEKKDRFKKSVNSNTRKTTRKPFTTARDD